MVRDVIGLLEADGWQQERQRGSHRIFRHPDEGAVACRWGVSQAWIWPPGTLASIRRQAGLDQLR